MAIRKQDMHKINDYLWEIPRGFRPNMRVPARIYADETLLEEAFRDRSMEQLVNTTTLPGLVKYTIVMPDVHQGYGFPIGGVAATRLPSGVISPGGVGYDINCLSGDSLILHYHGYTRPIADMTEDWNHAELVCQDFSAYHEVCTGIARYLKLTPANTVYRVITEAGDEIVTTADHPFWTPHGMVEVEQLQPGDRVAVYPFEGVPYEEPGDEIIIDEGDIERVLLGLGKDSQGNTRRQIITQLRKRGLGSVCCNSPELPTLLKVLGFVLGDGTVYFTNQTGKGVTWFYGKPEDLETIRRDVAAIGFTPSRVYRRQREHQVTTTYDDYSFSYEEASFKVVSSSFAALLAALGTPIGNKADQEYTVPGWLFKAPLWQKRLFLAAFFGAELSKPRTFEEHGYNFYTPILSMNKRESFVQSGHAFLEDIAELLSDFGVEVNTISQRRAQRNADGSISHRLRLIISSQPESLMNLWGKVGFEYNQERRALANVAVQYLKHKQRVLQMRNEAAEKATVMYAEGIAPTDIYSELVGTHVNRRFVERSLYGGRKTTARVSSNFPIFETYRQQSTGGLGQSGMVWDPIASIEPLPFNDYVYDFTVQHPDHNFVANGFVVSNCGVRLLASHLEHEEIEPYIEDLTSSMYANCPSGVGKKGHLRLSAGELEEVLRDGSRWALRRGFARPEDVERTEEQGQLASADPNKVSKKAKNRGRGQVGTLGAGNHFIEVDEVTEIYDAEVAGRFGLRLGQIAVQVHCGSRGFGHQVCTDYVRIFQKAVKRYGINLPDRELVCAPLDSPEGQDYFAAMCCAANYAFANRQVLTHHVRRSFEQVLAGKVSDWDVYQVYDITHNIAKIETHWIDGKRMEVCVHRKGATRAFGPGFEGLPEEYRDVGQPVLVPGSMGTASYVLVGTQASMDQAFGSTCHGAGRVMSRTKAKKTVWGSQLRDELEGRGIVVRAGSMAGLAEEAPVAYKDVSRVVEVVHNAGIARKVARLEPLAVIKG